MMMYVNLFWIWGHPEVYIVILPAFGVFSEVVATFSGKRLFGYRSLVYATAAIMVLSFSVWVHHFFTMGAGPDVNTFFGIATMMIAIPTGVKIFNWLFTMYRGRIRFTTPMYWTLGFIATFAVGGMAGVLLSVPPADYVLHNSLFLIAHFHNMLIPGSLVRLFCRLFLLVSEGHRLSPERKVGQTGILVLADWFLSCLCAPVRAGFHGHAPPHGALRQPGLAALADHRGGGRGRDPVRHPITS